MASYEQECPFVQRMLKLAGVVPDRVADPKVECGGETGVDVLCLIDGRKIGVQVTEYVPDFGLSQTPDKSSRGEEKKLARQIPAVTDCSYGSIYHCAGTKPEDETSEDLFRGR